MASRRTLAAALGVLAILAAGCATVPTAAPVRPIRPVSGQAQAFVQLLPSAGPDQGWSPAQVVQGFLHASANLTDHYAAARKYLAPALRKAWRPAALPVTVVSQQGENLTEVKQGPRNINGQSTDIYRVQLSGQQLATLTETNQYVPNTAPVSQLYAFTLGFLDDQWLIVSPPTTLLLTSDDFELSYQQMDLYYFGPAGTLVPDPVFAPQQATNSALASKLVQALFSNKGSWLAGATSTAFPPGTRAVGSIPISGLTATVNLGGAAAHATPRTLERMAAQLVWTLTSPANSTSASIRWVRLAINGRVRRINGSATQQLSMYQRLVPDESQPMPQDAPAGYYLGPGGSLAELSAGRSLPVTSPAGLAQLPVGALAVSLNAPVRVAVATPGPGCAVYEGPIGSARHPMRRVFASASAQCYSLSWDLQGQLWVSTGQAVWMVPAATTLPPVAVSLPPNLAPGSRILQLRVAPDGVRVAMLVQPPAGGSQLWVAAISRTTAAAPGETSVHGRPEPRPLVLRADSAVQVAASVTNPVALSWYDADHLIVLAGSQVWQVPLNGSAGTSIGAPLPPGASSISTNGLDLAAGTSAGGGQILVWSGLQGWQPAGPGRLPAYPG